MKKKKKKALHEANKKKISSEDKIYIEEQEEGEAKLVRDVLWCMQGIDGSCVYRSLAPGEGYVVDRTLAPKLSIVDRIRELCELGWLYRRIVRLCGDGRESQHYLLGTSKTLTALCSALREELAEYYRLIAILESQAALGTSSIQDVDDTEIEEQRLSLRRLAVWTMEPKERLKCMAAVCDAVRPNHVRGGALLSVLDARTKHGDPATRSLLVSLTTRAAQPMFIALKNWILAGELGKRDEDFFIFSTTNTEKVDSSYSFWKNKYKLRRSNVPSFVADPQLILNLGKAINFMRHCCGAKNIFSTDSKQAYFVLDDEDDDKIQDEATHKNKISIDSVFAYGNSPDLCTLVRERSEKANRCLVSALMGSKFQLMDHLKALKACLLLAQGDFTVLLVRKLADCLKPSASSAFSASGQHDIWTAVYSAIRGSNAVKLSKLEACLRVVIISNNSKGASSRSSGLDYAPPKPIDVVVHPQALALYRRLHDTMLARAFVEAHLNDTWRQYRLAERALNRLPAHIRLVLHRSALARGRMAQLVQALGQRYNTAVDANWAILVQQLKMGASLDQLILAHDTYLANVAIQVLLDPGLKLALDEEFSPADPVEETFTQDDCLSLAELLVAALQHASTFCALLTTYINDALVADHQSDRNTYRADLLSRLVTRLDEAISQFDDTSQRINTLLSTSNSLILSDFAIHLNASFSSFVKH
mmetsp:Transcript_4506/g.6797  ORF Transcript_4506/g.6797 Transcript_4506/m.6797 type:complete len:705 (-) Transcript_4506:44-2158(-)